MKKTVTVAAVAAATALLAGAALAHTSIAESDPADNSTVEALPAEVSIRFGNPDVPVPQPAQLTEATLLLLDPCGARVDNEDAAWDQTTSTISASTKASETAGRYEMHWSGTSTDGDTQAGYVDFVVSGGEQCALVQRTDAADDIDLGFNPTKVTSKPTAAGANVTVALAAAPACKAFRVEGQRLELAMDTNWDESVDYTGAFTCRAKKVRRNGVVKNVAVYGLEVTKASDETPSLKFKVRKTGAKALTAAVPSTILEDQEAGSLDLYVSSTTESDECGEDKSCADRAPDLGWVRSL
ncbi:MAG TPA: copper resistance protein CopC [Actinomycetota bacterium]|nr:copper resistance protein CopC [Actinomycetota bacterium]